MKAICFGAAGGGERLLEEISRKYEVAAFTDNDARKWGSTCCGIRVLSPEQCLNGAEYDYVIITSAPGLESIKKQCLEMGIPENRVISSYVEAPLQSRITFLKSFTEMYGGDLESNVAEAGVFQGDFAKEINRFFPNKKLHLFDTFSGFDKKDIQKEANMSKAAEGDYEYTSVELVMSKMPYPANCVIHKGYFPDTAYDGQVEKEAFCFVNLDMDLYEPTYQGLKFFSQRMEKNGIILVHDYFAENFEGPKKAVQRFMSEQERKLCVMPIGDGISVALSGF